MATIKDFDTKTLGKLHIINPTSHKGTNGRILVIGGSTLFHSASIWAAELAAHFVDHVFYYSPAHINREILLQSKTEFRNGFIVEAKDLEAYIDEADVILIGPGLRRQELRTPHLNMGINTIEEIENITDEPIQSYILTNVLLHQYPQKKWVIDAGALQEIELSNITQSCILTPHQQEFGRLFPQAAKLSGLDENALCTVLENTVENVPATWLLKRQGIDYIIAPHTDIIRVTDGNEGLIKGGTGDLLAALVAVLYVSYPPQEAASLASYILKITAEDLYKIQGPYFTTTELMQRIPVQVAKKSLKTKR